MSDSQFILCHLLAEEMSNLQFILCHLIAEEMSNSEFFNNASKVGCWTLRYHNERVIGAQEIKKNNFILEIFQSFFVNQVK